MSYDNTGAVAPHPAAVLAYQMQVRAKNAKNGANVAGKNAGSGIHELANFLAAKGKLAAHDVRALPGSTARAANTAVVQPWADFLTTGHVSAKHNKAIDALTQATIDGTVQTAAHPLRDPLQTLLLASPLLRGRIPSIPRVPPGTKAALLQKMAQGSRSGRAVVDNGPRNLGDLQHALANNPNLMVRGGGPESNPRPIDPKFMPYLKNSDQAGMLDQRVRYMGGRNEIPEYPEEIAREVYEDGQINPKRAGEELRQLKIRYGLEESQYANEWTRRNTQPGPFKEGMANLRLGMSKDQGVRRPPGKPILPQKPPPKPPSVEDVHRHTLNLVQRQAGIKPPRTFEGEYGMVNNPEEAAHLRNSLARQDPEFTMIRGRNKDPRVRRSMGRSMFPSGDEHGEVTAILRYLLEQAHGRTQ